jgi:hypothetical protein
LITGSEGYAPVPDIDSRSGRLFFYETPLVFSVKVNGGGINYVPGRLFDALLGVVIISI